MRKRRMTARRRRILVVDDEIGLTRLLQLNLVDAGGYEVRTENSGPAGLAAIREFKPHLVLLDVVMPGMTGREFASLLRADPALAQTPIIFMTALPPEGTADSRDGMLDGHPRMTKPLGTAHLVAAIDAILSGPRGLLDTG